MCNATAMGIRKQAAVEVGSRGPLAHKTPFEDIHGKIAARGKCAKLPRAPPGGARAKI